MDSPPPKLIVGQDRADRISALTDHLLLDILERLDLREAVRAGALSTRWRHLPNHLSCVQLDVGQFQGRGATPLEAMDAFTGAARALLNANAVPPVEGQCERGALKVLILSFYISSPHLSSIGRHVVPIVSLGHTECLEFCVSPPPSRYTILPLTNLHTKIIWQQFMSFSRDYPVAFSWLTRLTLKDLVFGHSDITDLISACGRLRHLSLLFCSPVDLHPTLSIDVPHSGIQELKFAFVVCTRIELISVPKLRQVECYYLPFENPPVGFGYVPELRIVHLCSKAKEWRVPFALSKCLSKSATNLSKLHLDFGHQMIWIQPEHPKQLTAIFRNLTSVFLFGIFSECDLNWTLFILEAAPVLQDIALSRHSCIKTPQNSAEKTNVVWEPSKDLKHLNLKALLIHGCKDEDKVTNYTRLVLERAVGLKRILLCDQLPCADCNAINPESSLRRSQVDEASRHRIKQRLTRGSSLSVDIIIC